MSGDGFVADGFTPDSDDGFTPDSPAPKKKSRGFVGELVNEVKNGPANLLRVGNAINQAVTHPIDTFNAVGQQIEDTAKKAKERWQSGDIKGAVRAGINTGFNVVAPGLGTSNEEAGEMFDRGDTAGGLGKTAGIGINAAIGAKSPRIAKGIGTAVAETLTPGVKGPAGRMFQADPRVAATRALRPTPTESNWSENTPNALERIKEASGGEAPVGVTNGKLDLIEGANKAVAKQQQAMDQWLARGKGVTVSGDELVKATRDAIPAIMREREPAAVAGLIDRAQQAFGGKSYTVQQFRDFLKSDNADLKRFYSNAGAQADAIAAGTPDAIQEAQTAAMRDVLYKALDPEGAGAGPRTIGRNTRDIIRIRDGATRRNNAIVAEQPVSPFDRIIDPIKAHLPSFMTPKGAATGLSFSEGQVGRSLPLLKRAFNAVGDSPNVAPLPGEPLYPTGNTARQITSGDVITPPPSDMSFVRGIPGMASPPNAARALPAGPQVRVTPPPADPSGINVTTGPPLRAPVGRELPPGPSVRTPSDLSGNAGDVTDLVPVKNPITGKIEYIPRPKGMELPRRYAKGGIVGLDGPEQVIVGDGGEPEAVIPLSHIRAMGPQAQRHLLKGIGVHLGIGKTHKSTLGEELGGKRHLEIK